MIEKKINLDLAKIAILKRRYIDRTLLCDLYGLRERVEQDPVTGALFSVEEPYLRDTNISFCYGKYPFKLTDLEIYQLDNALI